MLNRRGTHSPRAISAPPTLETHSPAPSIQEEKAMEGDYEFLGQIGSGGFGVVFMARYKHDQKLYAVKVISRYNEQGYNLTDSLIQEIMILNELDHPFIIKCYEHYFDFTQAFITLELALGDLEQIIRHYKLTEAQVKKIVLDLAYALEHIHQKHIIHRDIKLANVLIGYDGRIKLSDFGLAAITSSGFARGICGTPYAQAPEMLRQIPYTKAVDWWALGVMAFEMLTGTMPFWSCNGRSLTYNIIHSNPQFPPSVSPDCRTVVELLLEMDPESRICSLQQLQLADFFDDVTYGS